MTEARNGRILQCCGPESGLFAPAARTAEGWSLIELLVAAALSMSLATLALRAYLAGNGLQAEITAQLRLQEGARFALHVLGANVRLAGFPGCLGETPQSSPLHPDWPGPVEFSAVEGWNANRPHPWLDAAPGREVIAFWWSVTGCGVSGPPEMQPASDSSSIEPGSALRGSLFYLGRRGDSADNPPALFIRGLSNFEESRPGRELVEGVESMRIFYGMADNPVFLPAHRVQNWQDVRSVRFELRLRNQSPPDIRRDFNQTLALRNKSIDIADFFRFDANSAENTL